MGRRVRHANFQSIVGAQNFLIVQRDHVSHSTDVTLTAEAFMVDAAHSPAPAHTKRPTWEQSEGTPMPFGATWIEAEQAFNFAVHTEHAESVTLLLYSSTDLVNPLLTFRFDFLRNKSGRIWHCRIPIAEIREARYYAYSVSGQSAPQLHSFDQRRFSSTRMRNAFSSLPVLIANWLCERDRTQAGRLWERWPVIVRRLTGRRPETASRIGCDHL